MLKPILLVLTLAMAAVGSATHAAEVNTTVQGLYQMCKLTDGSFDEIYCVGYISGASDQLNLNGQAARLTNGETKATYARAGTCGQTTYGAKLQAFLNWTEKHPEHWNLPRQIGLAMALKETWPCKQTE